MTEHTPEPWQQKHDWDIEGATTIIANVDAEIDSEGTHYSYDVVAICHDDFDDRLPEAQANARRIVACVNALKGIDIAVIEAGVVQELASAARGLLAMCDEIARRLGWPDNRRREALRAALSKWEASK